MAHDELIREVSSHVYGRRDVAVPFAGGELTFEWRQGGEHSRLHADFRLDGRRPFCASIDHRPDDGFVGFVAHVLHEVERITTPKAVDG